MAIKDRRSQRRLPVQQLVILSICRFAEPIASTSLLPYLPAMVRSFNIPEQDVGKWAGITAASFSLSQAAMGILWGRFSDVYGRKLPIMLGLASTMITTLMWGFSPNLSIAIIARALAGAGNGNVGIIRTTVAEMVPYKELQPVAFSIMPLVWNVGSVLGPAIGGALANPANVQPGQTFESPTFLQKFPYALPNLVSAGFFMIGILTGILFLEETLDVCKGDRGWGLRIGDQLTTLWKRVKGKAQPTLENEIELDDEETASFLKPSSHAEAGITQISKSARPPPPSFREVLNRQAILNLLAYTLLAMHNMAFDQLLPVYLQYPSIFSGDAATTKPIAGTNPLRFAGGASLSHFTIGLLSTGNGIYGMVLQFLIYPRIARRFGVLNCLKYCSLAFPIACFLMPWTALISSPRWQITACFAVVLFKCTCALFAFPCSTILLTNSASSARTLGTLNGFATSTSAIGRAIGPALGGAIFSYGVKRGYVLAPWWTLALIAIIAAIPVWWLVEGDGFNTLEDPTNGEDFNTLEDPTNGEDGDMNDDAPLKTTGTDLFDVAPSQHLRKDSAMDSADLNGQTSKMGDPSTFDLERDESDEDETRYDSMPKDILLRDYKRDSARGQ